MVGSRMAAAAGHTLGIGLGGALGAACVAMIGLALFFNRVVLRPLFHRSLLSLIMVTIGVGIFMRGAATVLFAWLPLRIVSPFPVNPLVLRGLPGTITAALVVGILESLVTGYPDPLGGGGFSHVASYLVLIAALLIRPYGFLGRPDVERV